MSVEVEQSSPPVPFISRIKNHPLFTFNNLTNSLLLSASTVLVVSIISNRHFQKNGFQAANTTRFAARALAYGTGYAFGGCGILVGGIAKIVGQESVRITEITVFCFFNILLSRRLIN